MRAKFEIGQLVRLGKVRGIYDDRLLNIEGRIPYNGSWLYHVVSVVGDDSELHMEDRLVPTCRVCGKMEDAPETSPRRCRCSGR